ncbi:MAG: hypothetical protein M1833_002678 [Piccolia ochrophora]|nr:MAG: hypothetical protein M1833_002678 [Piccolia ochrophora]
MSKRQFRSQASSGRAGFGSPGPSSAFGVTSSLSYIAEPPDLFSISDSNVVVAFKNLSKKDATTKAKALEELQSYIGPVAEGESAGPEDGVLEAWIKLYPRTSIDSSRRVRQLAHTLQGQIASASGKRIAKHMPAVIGPWLAGLYDNDRPVAAAAQDAFNQVFPGQEKMRNIWKVYERAIMEHAQNAVFRETVLTLSDERTVSPDDAKAKHSRVVATGISLLTNMMSEVDTNTLAKEQDFMDELLRDERLWKCSSHEDPFVRRSVYRLLRASIIKQHNLINSVLSILGTAFIYKALSIDQSGSAWDFSDTLVALTLSFSNVWTDGYTAKKSPISRLQLYLKGGSQGGSSEVWRNHSRLIGALPQSALPQDLSTAQGLLEAMHEGISRKDEPRSNLSAAWTSYSTVVRRLLIALPRSEDKVELANHGLLPIFKQQIKSSPDKSRWSTGAQGSDICAAAFAGISQLNIVPLHELLSKEWWTISEMIIQDIRASSPAQSKGFDESQRRVSAEGERWAMLNKAILKELQTPGFHNDLLVQTSVSIVKAAAEVLRNRNGSLYSILHLFSAQAKQSPSGPERQSKDVEILYEAYRRTVEAILAEPDRTERQMLLHQLLSRGIFAENLSAPKVEELDSFVLQSYRDAMQGSNKLWDLVGRALSQKGDVLARETRSTILDGLMQGLSVSDKAAHALTGIESISKSNAPLLRALVLENPEVLSNILRLSESPDENLANQAEAVNVSAEAMMAEDDGKAFITTMRSIITNGLEEAGPDSIAVPSLVDRAMTIIKTCEEAHEEPSSELLPSTEHWLAVLNPFLDTRPSSTLSITDPLGGAVFLIASEDIDAPASPKQQKDQFGYSAALRMAMYTTQLIQVKDVFTTSDHHTKSQIFRALLLTMQLANDNLSLAGTNDLWFEDESGSELEVAEFVSQSQRLLQQWIQDEVKREEEGKLASSGSYVRLAQDSLKKSATGLTPSAFYNARAIAMVYEESVEVQQSKGRSSELLTTDLQALRKTKDTFLVIALIVGYKTPMATGRVALRLCNELVSDLSVLQLSKSEEVVRKVVLQNSIIQHQDIITDVPKHRIVPMVKHVLDWADEGLIKSPYAASEVARMLLVVLPVIQDVYGSHWSSTISWIEQVWLHSLTTDEYLPAIHFALRLHALLAKIHQANDDADEAWREAKDSLSLALVSLLKRLPDVSDEFNQPRRIINELLKRQIAMARIEHIENHVELYSLVFAKSTSIQIVAFDLLHRHIPALQEEVSLDVALTNSSAHLPDELISMVLKIPTSDILTSSSLPQDLRGYLFSWVLMFDHFKNASHKVRSDYVEHMKERKIMAGLLDLMAAFLGHDQAKPANASRFDITSYTPDREDSPQKEAQWLLVHLYFSCLKYTPSLTKQWWINCPRRQVVLSVETWTEKYISPLVITEELTTVGHWAETTAKDTDSELKIKVSKNAKEVVVGYDVDEQTLQIIVRLPASYPLRSVIVDGLNRVAVDEKKWQSWLRITQGVITFSNGSIIDGLSAWRKNVSGAMKGQTECAICYSIISVDKQLPTKKCTTCKHLFHSSCLFKWFKSSNSSSCPLCRNPWKA